MDNNFYALKQLILEKTQGTPFFMEEIVQELKEQGVLKHDASVGWVVTHPTTALKIPTTVQGVLAARIDRLAPDEKALLQQLSVIGREFPLGLVRHVVPQSKIETDPRPLTPDPHGEAEACFLKAIEITQKQQAKSLELRAVMSLARLWQRQGKTAEARQMLAEIYGWFTEGLDTKDLQEAKALLEELS